MESSNGWSAEHVARGAAGRVPGYIWGYDEKAGVVACRSRPGSEAIEVGADGWRDCASKGIDGKWYASPWPRILCNGKPPERNYIAV